MLDAEAEDVEEVVGDAAEGRWCSSFADLPGLVAGGPATLGTYVFEEWAAQVMLVFTREGVDFSPFLAELPRLTRMCTRWELRS